MRLSLRFIIPLLLALAVFGFINYILDAKVGARLSTFTRFASPNKAALAYLPATDLKNPAIYPSAELRARLEFLEDLGSRTRLFDEIWTQVKSR